MMGTDAFHESAIDGIMLPTIAEIAVTVLLAFHKRRSRLYRSLLAGQRQRLSHLTPRGQRHG